MKQDCEYTIQEAISELNGVLDKLNGLVSDKNNKEHLKNASWEYILNGVCLFYGIERSYLRLNKRNREIIERRQITSRLLHEFTNLTSMQIAELLGYKNHATVLHHLKKVDGLLSNEFYGNVEIKKTYQQLLNHLKL